MPKRTKKPEKPEPRDIATDKTDALTRDMVVAAESLEREFKQPTPEEFAAVLRDHHASMNGRACPTCGTAKTGNRCEVCGHQEHDT